MSGARILLARHGQSLWQLTPGCGGDSALSFLGHRQALLLGRWLAAAPRVDGVRRLHIAAVHTSPLQRARQTAAYPAALLALAPTVQEDLREAAFHVAAHLPPGPRPPPVGLRSAPIGGGTAGEDERRAAYDGFKEQAWSALTGLAASAERARRCEEGGAVLAVSHAGLIKTLLRLAAGSDAICFRIYNTGLCALEWRRDRWHLVHLNLWDHLPPDLRTR
ncbi:histidine phosphatase family protein [Nocardiopsis suaedae]|uniref:Histidine phosphatase family protein n=1 Tax=Nocardiopsis suaedae TaxID=3018444 RepID=A0ABT4TG18_9ACTN|nr:histidine phosphatase family protein [Nocardiopsis suaedae]MDA2803647.1 histidine phosphatase family protein [Nocardiopsis suaedae]